MKQEKFIFLSLKKLFNSSLKNLPININNHIEAMKHFIEQMDIEMIDAFLDANRRYFSEDKRSFLKQLNHVFEVFKSEADTYLISIEGRCNKCNMAKTGYTFVGNNSKRFINIIFYTEGEKLIDFGPCFDFKNNQSDLTLNKIIYLDDYVYEYEEEHQWRQKPPYKYYCKMESDKIIVDIEYIYKMQKDRLPKLKVYRKFVERMIPLSNEKNYQDKEIAKLFLDAYFNHTEHEKIIDEVIYDLDEFKEFLEAGEIFGVSVKETLDIYKTSKVFEEDK